VRVRRDSLATILPLVEDAVVQESREVLDFVELQAALEYLRTAMSRANQQPEGEGK
jgi:hypothetical protein